MATTTLSRYEAEECQFPRICARCGAPADTTASKKFTWSPPWLFLLVLAGLIGWIVLLILSLTLSKRMRVTLPFCQQHVNHWKLRYQLILGSLVAVAAFEVALLLLSNGLKGMRNENLLLVSCCGIPLVWVIAAIVMDLTSIRCQQMTDQSIKLSGLSQQFVDAVEAEHARYLNLLANPYDPRTGEEHRPPVPPPPAADRPAEPRRCLLRSPWTTLILIPDR